MILLNDFRRQWEDTREDVLRAVDRVGASGWYIMGAELREFERELAALWGLPYCAGVASGLDAIEISLRVLGCKPGDRVLTTPLSAFATTLAIVKLGAIPVFVDTDDYGLIDLDRCAELLARRPDIRFMVPVHLYGNALDLDKLTTLKQRFGLAIVEDCAQSILATHNGRMTGTVGDMAATSFYPTKNLGALGDGGAILTPSEERWRAVQTLRDYGQSAKYRHDAIGYNSRLDELQAAILRLKLRRLAAWTERRRTLAQLYISLLRDVGLCLPVEQPYASAVYHLFVARHPRRDELAEALRRRGVATLIHYPVPIHLQPAFASLGVAEGQLPVAEKASREILSLPLYPEMRDEQVAAVASAVRDAVAEVR